MSRLAANLEGDDVRVVTFGGRGAAEVDSSSSIETVRMATRGGPAHKLAVVRLNAGAMAEARRFRPEATICAHPLTAPAAASAPGPTVHYAHADEFRHRPRLARFAMRRASAVVAISEYASDLAIRSGADPAKVHVVSPGVDPAPVSVDRAQTGRPTILTVARMAQAHKGHDVMIEALVHVRETIPDVLWVAVGDGPLRADLEALARRLGVSGSARFVGDVDDSERDRWMASADVFAMPSRIPPDGLGGEGYGIVFLEAGAAGVPVVGPRTGGPRDAVVEGETGILVNPKDPAELASALTGLLRDPDRSRELGEAGARRAAALTWRRHAEAVRAIASELVQEGQAR